MPLWRTAARCPRARCDGLPGGVDDMLEAWFGAGGPPEPDALSAMVAVVDRKRQGQGLSRHVIEAMVDIARRNGFSELIAPVRPTWKDRYPLIPMERYARWKRDDGLPFDPWLRVHARLGAELVEVCPASMRIEGSAAEWEEWTGIAYPGRRRLRRPGRARARPLRRRARHISRAERLDAAHGRLTPPPRRYGCAGSGAGENASWTTRSTRSRLPSAAG